MPASGKGAPEATVGQRAGEDRALNPDDQNAKDEADYRARLAEVNRRLETARAFYLSWMLQGGTPMNSTMPGLSI